MLDTNRYPITVFGFQGGISLFQHHADHVFFRRGCWQHQDFHLTAFQLRITLQGRGWRVLGLSKGSQWQCWQHFAKGFPPVPASLPSPLPLYTHIPHRIQDISENTFFWTVEDFQHFQPKMFMGAEMFFLISRSPAKCQMKRSNYGS